MIPTYVRRRKATLADIKSGQFRLFPHWHITLSFKAKQSGKKAILRTSVSMLLYEYLEE
jgi:hypothetical protein